MTLFDELGGTACLERVHRIFYGKLLAHPWLRGFFHGKERDHLESQQTDFMTGMFGGPKCYFGRAVGCAHIHLFISDEVFTVRHDLLADSLAEAGVRRALAVSRHEHEARPDLGNAGGVQGPFRQRGALDRPQTRQPRRGRRHNAWSDCRNSDSSSDCEVMPSFA